MNNYANWNWIVSYEFTNMDQLTSLRTFCLVAEHRRFRIAADRLGMSPAMVSKHVANLEARLGLRLLNRNSRHVVLTDDGYAYHAKVRGLLDELDELDASLSDRSAQVGGTIHLSAPVWMGNARFAELLHAFTQAHPNVTFEVDLSARAVNLVEEGFDLALRVSRSLPPGLIARVIGQVSFGFYASPSYLAVNDPPRTLADISRHPMLTYAGLPKLPNFEQLVGSVAHAQSSNPIRSVLSSESEILLRHCAISGMGLVFLPDWLAAEDLAAGRLERVLANEFNSMVNLQAIYPSRRLLPAKVRKFLDFLLAAQNDKFGVNSRSAEQARPRREGPAS